MLMTDLSSHQIYCIFFSSNDSETSNIYDLNEPPSKTANLQPEFSQHPWVLEQVRYLFCFFAIVKIF